MQILKRAFHKLRVLPHLHYPNLLTLELSNEVPYRDFTQEALKLPEEKVKVPKKLIFLK